VRITDVYCNVDSYFTLGNLDYVVMNEHLLVHGLRIRDVASRHRGSIRLAYW
jgi:hypothetical protein